MDSNENLRYAAEVLIDTEKSLSAKQRADRCIVEYIKTVAPKVQSADYRVMEYNILRDGDGWGWTGLTQPKVDCSRRINLVESIVKGYLPDVIGAVERYDCWEEEGNLTARMNRLGYSVAESALPEEIRLIWDRDHPDRKFNRHPLFYRNDRFICIKSHCFPIQAFPSINFRVLTSVILQDRQTEREIAFFVTHWESGGIQKEGVEPKTPEECRMINAEKTEKAFRLFLEEYPTLPAVLMGDFNTNPADPAYQQVLKNCGLVDITGNPDGIDRLAVRKLKVISSQMDCAPYTGFASDHKPIYCDVKEQ